MASEYAAQGSSTSLSKDTVTHALPAYGVALLQRLNLLRRHSAFCDVIIHVDDKRFPAHRSVLAAACPKMYELLESLQPEPGNNYSTLHLTTLSSIGVEYILDSIYTGSLEFNKSYLHDVRAVAKYFELNDIVKICNSHDKQSIKNASHKEQVDDQFSTISEYGGHSDSTNYLNFYLDKLSHSVSDYFDTSKIQSGDLDFTDYGIGDSGQLSGKSDSPSDLLGTEAMSEYDYMQLLELQYVGNQSSTSPPGGSHTADTSSTLPILRPKHSSDGASKQSCDEVDHSDYLTRSHADQDEEPSDKDSGTKRQRLPGLMELFRASQKNTKNSSGSQRRSLLAPVSDEPESMCPSLQEPSPMIPISHQRHGAPDGSQATGKQLITLADTDATQSQSVDSSDPHHSQTVTTQKSDQSRPDQSSLPNYVQASLSSQSSASQTIQTLVSSNSTDIYPSTSCLSGSAQSELQHIPQSTQSSAAYQSHSMHPSASCLPGFMQSSRSYQPQSVHTAHQSNFMQSSVSHQPQSVQTSGPLFSHSSSTHAHPTEVQEEQETNENFLASYLPHNRQIEVAHSHATFSDHFTGDDIPQHFHSQSHTIQTDIRYPPQQVQPPCPRLTQSFQSLISHQPLYLQSPISGQQYTMTSTTTQSFPQHVPTSLLSSSAQTPMVHSSQHERTYLSSATSTSFSAFPTPYAAGADADFLHMTRQIAQENTLEFSEQKAEGVEANPNEIIQQKGNNSEIAQQEESHASHGMANSVLSGHDRTGNTHPAGGDLEYCHLESSQKHQEDVEPTLGSAQSVGNIKHSTFSQQNTSTKPHVRRVRKNAAKNNSSGFEKAPFEEAVSIYVEEGERRSAKRGNVKKARLAVFVHCSKCARSFRSERMLKAHEEKHEMQTMMLTCTICYQTFSRASELTSHLHWHSDTTFTCTYCNIDIKDPKKFKQHMVKNHGEKKCFTCTYPDCQFRSDRYSRIQTHSTTHSSLRMYTCSRCNKCFRQADGLRHHTRCCQQRRSYLCDLCGSKFNRLDALRRHKLKHSGLKPYSCNSCTASFNSKVNLKRHQRIHKNLFPYTCNLCRRKFRHSNTLKSHYKRCQRDMEKRRLKQGVNAYPHHLSYHQNPHPHPDPHYSLHPKLHSDQQSIPPGHQHLQTESQQQQQQQLPPTGNSQHPVTSEVLTPGEAVITTTSSTDWSLFFSDSYGNESSYL